jgi:hypothetical protein
MDGACCRTLACRSFHCPTKDIALLAVLLYLPFIQLRVWLKACARLQQAHMRQPSASASRLAKPLGSS